MEFDVVFLSMVRTLPEESYIKRRKAITEEEGKDWTDEMEARISFGHLCLYNRLNVSMSRQKKLLIVAGDSGLLQNDLAVKFIPGLVNFLQLCKTEGRILQCR
jgi:superfamily I DNA and/or RNA helicase